MCHSLHNWGAEGAFNQRFQLMYTHLEKIGEALSDKTGTLILSQSQQRTWLSVRTFKKHCNYCPSWSELDANRSAKNYGACRKTERPLCPTFAAFGSVHSQMESAQWITASLNVVRRGKDLPRDGQLRLMVTFVTNAILSTQELTDIAMRRELVLGTVQWWTLEGIGEKLQKFVEQKNRTVVDPQIGKVYGLEVRHVVYRFALKRFSTMKSSLLLSLWSKRSHQASRAFLHWLRQWNAC